MKQLNVRLDDETHALLVAQAEANVRSANAQVTWLIRNSASTRILALHKRDRRGNCKECDGYDGEHGGRTVRWPCPTVKALSDTLDTEETQP